MRIGDKGLFLIKSFEKLRLVAYDDATGRDVVSEDGPVRGVLTIGYGHTGGVYPGLTITETHADELLRSDLRRFELEVYRVVKKFPPLTQNMFDAMVSLAFNIGAEAFRKSTVVREYENGNISHAADAFLWWNKTRIDGKFVESKGLMRRREAERALFLME